MAESARKRGKGAEASGPIVSRERVLVGVLTVATAAAVLLCLLIARPFLPSLAWALAIAVVTHPLHRWMARRIPSENLSAAAAVTIVTVGIVAPAIFVTQALVWQAAGGVERLQQDPATMRWETVLERNPSLAPTLRWIQEKVNVRGQLEQLAGALASRVSAIVTGGVWMFAQLLITLFFLFFFFRDRRAVLERLRSLVPLSRGETDSLFERISSTIHATIYGSVVVALVQGFLGGLMFWILGLPAALLWGTVMGLLAIVPVLGTFVVWFPASVFLFLEGSWIRALVLFGWGTTAIALVDNLLYPTLVGKDLELHTIPVFISLVGGIALFGMSGLILGPVTMAVTLGLVEIWKRRTAEA